VTKVTLIPSHGL